MNEDPSAPERAVPDLDAIARSFDEIEGALRRLDDGTYFDSPDADRPNPGFGGRGPVTGEVGGTSE